MEKICVKFISKCSECTHCINTYGFFHECGLTKERIYSIFHIPESCPLEDRGKLIATQIKEESNEDLQDD
jgi:hypothetical protein